MRTISTIAILMIMIVQSQAQTKKHLAKLPMYKRQSNTFCFLADSEIRSHNYMNAFNLATDAVVIDSTNAYAFFLKAYSEWHLQRNDDAIKDFSRSIKLNPNDAGSYCYRADLEEGDDPKKALEDFGIAIRLSKSKSLLAMFYEHRASLRVDMLDWIGALQDCNKSILYQPADNCTAYTLRGKINLENENYTAAIQDCNTSIHMEPLLDSNPYLTRGIAKIKLGKSDSGCEDFAKAKEISPNYSKVTAAINKYCK